MNPLLEALNALLADALAQAAGTAPAPGVRLGGVTLDEDGARIVLRLAPPAGEGECVLRLRVAPAEALADGALHALTLTLEQGPAQWPPALDAFRGVVERARLQLTLHLPAPA